MSEPKVGLQVHALRGVVELTDGEGRKVELQVVRYGEIAEIRAGRGNELAAVQRANEFARKLEALLDDYEIPRYYTHHLT